jgi:hypothetical protein
VDAATTRSRKLYETSDKNDAVCSRLGGIWGAIGSYGTYGWGSQSGTNPPETLARKNLAHTEGLEPSAGESVNVTSGHTSR